MFDLKNCTFVKDDKNLSKVIFQVSACNIEQLYIIHKFSGYLSSILKIFQRIKCFRLDSKSKAKAVFSRFLSPLLDF